MRAAALAFTLTIAAAGLVPSPALAFDHDQFCIAARQVVRSTGVDVGTWIDRVTRYDGYDIGCDLKTVHFKRFHKSSSAPSNTWMERQAEIWESAYCGRSLWREAVANGWVISATVTTSAGQRVWLACLPTGKGFYRVMQ
jgi:hypothetical protein